jgi:hypothetical protein
MSDEVEQDEWTLRSTFNASGIWERKQRRELYERIVRNGEPDPNNNQPEGARSITSIIYELDERARARNVALVHYYRLPDGTINNAAGLPDPKWCLVEGVKYVLKP